MAIWPLSDILLVQLLIMLSPAYFLEAQIPDSTAQISTSWTNNLPIPAEHFDFCQMILMSEPQSFACGFCSKDQKNDSFYFAVVSLQLSYYADAANYSFTLQNVIWLANENKPVGQNATLKLLPEGNLVLRDADGALVWSTNTSNMSVAGIKMMKTGMLVLQDHNNKTVWQSFSDTAHVSTSWTNDPISAMPYNLYKIIMMHRAGFSCGFHSKDRNSFYFAIWKQSEYSGDDDPEALWFANRNRPVGQNATLQFLPDGDLVLRDTDGTFVWSTNTSNMSVAGMRMMETGMLVLQDHNNKIVWQSFSNTAHVSTSWTNNDPISAIPYNLYKIIMMHGARFSCGFHSEDRNSFYFAIWKQSEYSGDDESEALWLANRNRPVGQNATLQFLPDGDVVLRDTDGTFVWSTNTSNMSVAGMRMMETGNLELYDVNNKTVWNSFDHPSDVLLLGNKLVAGQKLVASVSKTNRSEGVFSLSVIPQGLFASYQATAPQTYFKFSVFGGIDSLQLSYDESSGDLALLIISASPDEPNTMFASTVKYSATAYMKFDPDGHLRIYDGNMIDGVDLLTDKMSACDYPTACGNYGLCSNGLCSCPAGFARANTPNDQGNYSCSQSSPTTCENPKSHSLLPLEDVYYFNYVDPEAAVLKGTDMKSCKDACLKNCSCNAALFQYYGNDSHGNCFLPSPVLTLMGDGKERNNYQSYAFIKISNDGENGSAFTSINPTSSINPKIIAGSTIGAILLMSLIVGLCIMKAQEDQLIDMVDNSSEDMQLHRLEAVEMVRVAIWCLQSDHTRRPSMSTVVKVLEGTMGVEADLDYCLQNATTMAAIRREAVLDSTATLLPSLLSGPR
ncbi:hypothetical protein Peur_053273 [Populus x canadensis]